MTTFKLNARVVVARGQSGKIGRTGVVVRQMMGESVGVQLDGDTPGNTRWFYASSLDLEGTPKPFNLNDKQLAVLEAANELREAQIKFQKALDAVNSNQ